MKRINYILIVIAWVAILSLPFRITDNILLHTAEVFAWVSVLLLGLKFHWRGKWDQDRKKFMAHTFPEKEYFSASKELLDAIGLYMQYVVTNSSRIKSCRPGSVYRESGTIYVNVYMYEVSVMELMSGSTTNPAVSMEFKGKTEKEVIEKMQVARFLLDQRIKPAE